MGSSAYNQKILDKIAELKERKSQPETHVNDHHGSGKDACIYCGKVSANEYETCPTGRTEKRKEINLKLAGGKARLKHLRTLPKSERQAVTSFFGDWTY